MSSGCLGKLSAGQLGGE